MRLNVRLQELTGWLVSSRLPVCLACLSVVVARNPGPPWPAFFAWPFHAHRSEEFLLRRERERDRQRDTRENGKKQQRAAAGLWGGSATHPIFGRSASHATQKPSSIPESDMADTRDLRRREPEKSGIGIAYLSLQQDRKPSCDCDPPAAPELEVSKFSRVGGGQGKATGNSADGTADPHAPTALTSPTMPTATTVVDGRRRTGLTVSCPNLAALSSC